MNNFLKDLRREFDDFWTSKLKKPFLILVSIAMGIIVVAVLAEELSRETKQTPCSPDSYPANCYHVSKDVCQFIWTKSEASCKEAIKGLNLSPGRLLSPILFKCQVASLDRNISTTRITSPECNRLHNELEDWLRSNPNFNEH
jgi:hypothetical protein